LVDYPENCLMVGLYHTYQANATEIDTRQLLRWLDMHVGGNF